MNKKIKQTKILDPFQNISEDVLTFEVMSYFSEKEIINFSLVNKEVKRICDNPLMWKILAEIKFSKERLKKLNIFIEDLKNQNEWKKIYKRLIQSSRFFQKEYQNVYRLLEMFERVKSNGLGEIFEVKTDEDLIKLIIKIYNMKKANKKDLDLFQRLTNQTKVLSRRRVYNGEMYDSILDGKGNISVGEEIRFIGNFNNNKYDGKGTYFRNDGGIKYTGDWKEGKKDGKGTYFLKDGGIKYTGDWKEGKKDGKGTYFYKSGEKYTGDWKDGKKDGKGTYFLKDGGIKYTGNWKEDKKDGKGTYFYKSGNKYTGDWKEDKKDGKGTFFYNSGNKYAGDWKEDKRDGKGTFFFNDGEKYTGDWKEGKKDGKGTYFYNDGEKYTGDWKEGKNDGKGTYFFNDGEKYTGDFKEDNFDGKGTYFYNDREKYTGDWKDGKKDGKGTYFYDNGNKYTGDWKEDKRDRSGTLFDSSGSIIFQGEYKNGILFYRKRFFNSGNIFELIEGEVKNGLKNGKATFHFDSNNNSTINKYEYNFKNNKTNGYKKIYFTSGDVYEIGKDEKDNF